MSHTCLNQPYMPYTCLNQQQRDIFEQTQVEPKKAAL